MQVKTSNCNKKFTTQANPVVSPRKSAHQAEAARSPAIPAPHKAAASRLHRSAYKIENARTAGVFIEIHDMRTDFYTGKAACVPPKRRARLRPGLIRAKGAVRPIFIASLLAMK